MGSLVLPIAAGSPLSSILLLQQGITNTSAKELLNYDDSELSLSWLFLKIYHTFRQTNN